MGNINKKDPRAVGLYGNQPRKVGETIGERRRLAQELPQPSSGGLQRIVDFFSPKKTRDLERFAADAHYGSGDRFKMLNPAGRLGRMEEGVSGGNRPITDDMRIRFLEALLKSKV